MQDDDSDDDLPLFSNIRQHESNITSDDVAVQTSRYTLTTTKSSCAKNDSSLLRSGALLSLDNTPLRTTGDFILMLDRLKIRGPLTVTDPLNSRHKIGEGGQFIVYRNTVLEHSDCSDKIWLDVVAVKKCKFHKIEEGQKLDLSSRKYRGQVHDMKLEIAVLRDVRLRDHPNIVKLIGFGLDPFTWHQTPFLVMQLAIGDLTRIFQDQKSPDVLHQLLLGVGYGLDAIHDRRIIHGDLKPENVLLFKTDLRPMPLIAKLADFGLSLDEVSTAGGGSVAISGYSVGWAAPEVAQAYHQNSWLLVDILLRSDRFSYGLLVLSAFCFEGRIPPASSYSSHGGIHKTVVSLPTSLLKILDRSLPLILDESPRARPERIGTLLEDKTEACLVWTQERDKYELWQTEQDRSVSTTYIHPWELPSLAGFHVLGIERFYRTYQNLLSGPQLFAMFLQRSVHDITSLDKELQVSILIAAARKGFPPAQGVVKQVIDSYGIKSTNLLIGTETETWLKTAVASGFRLPTCTMERIAPQDLETNQATFCSYSGYNQFYSPIAKPRDVRVSPNELKGTEGLPSDKPIDKNKNRSIHQLATYGEIEQLKALLDNNLSGINCRNGLGETALYKACLSGRADIVLFMCQKGADASLTSGGRRVTCLHWLFNFPASYIDRVVCALIAAGADPNASLTGRGSLVNYHFPLRWPAGTPLHWAVAISSLEAVKALVGQGADLLARNRQDPYKADENVRRLHSHGTDEQGEFSETPETCLGLNPVDLAVANHDWRVLEEMSSSYQGSTSDLFAVDEESYSPFHRLSLNRIVTTVTGSRFWYPAFMGAPATRKNNIRRTVHALKNMGGDINQLTGSPSKCGLPGVRGGLSPLMIAVSKSDFEVVETLCEEGADVNLQNRRGRTALTLMADLNVAGLSPPGSISAIVRSLVDHGADVKYQSPDGDTPLLFASHSGDLEAVNILAENGADLTSSAGLHAMARLIFEMAHSTHIQRSYLSITNSEQREIDLASFMDKFLQPSVRSNALLVSKSGKTLLHCCAQAALFACVKVLVVAGSSVNAIEELGRKKGDRYEFGTQWDFRGTPLDTVIHEEKMFESSRGERLPQAKVDYVFDKFKSIRKLLVDHGGKTITQLDNHVSP